MLFKKKEKKFINFTNKKKTLSLPSNYKKKYHKIEEELKKSEKFKWTILRTLFFQENLLLWKDSIMEGNLRLPIKDAKIPILSILDVADAAANVLVDGSEHYEKTYDVVGPELLGGNEMAKVLTEKLERPVVFESPDPKSTYEELVKMGVAEWQAKAFIELFEYIASGSYNEIESTKCEKQVVPHPVKFGIFVERNKSQLIRQKDRSSAESILDKSEKSELSESDKGKSEVENKSEFDSKVETSEIKKDENLKIALPAESESRPRSKSKSPRKSPKNAPPMSPREKQPGLFSFRVLRARGLKKGNYFVQVTQASNKKKVHKTEKQVHEKKTEEPSWEGEKANASVDNSREEVFVFSVHAKGIFASVIGEVQFPQLFLPVFEIFTFFSFC